MIALGRAAGVTLTLFFTLTLMAFMPRLATPALCLAAVAYGVVMIVPAGLPRRRVVCGIALMAVSALMGCSGSAAHRATVQAHVLAKALNTAAQINHDLAEQGVITSAERDLVGGYLVQATHTDDALNALGIEAYKSGSLDAKKALALLDTLIQQIDKLDTEGVLHLKSEDARTKFTLQITTAKAALSILEALLEANTKTAWLAPLEPPRMPLHSA